MIKNNDGTWTLTDEQMNKFIIYMAAAHYHYGKIGKPEKAYEVYQIQQEIYDKLDDAGYYNHK